MAAALATDIRYTSAICTPTEAAVLAGMPPTTVRSWMRAAGGRDPIVDGRVYIAFGHVPPVPGTPIPVPRQFPISVVGAYSFDLSMLLNIRESLNNFIEANPGLVGPAEPK